MNVQFTRGSGVATITLSAGEIDRFMASSHGIVNEMQLALQERRCRWRTTRQRRASGRVPQDARHVSLSPGVRRKSTSDGVGPNVGKHLVLTRDAFWGLHTVVSYSQ
jgi:hypothetical protein